MSKKLENITVLIPTFHRPLLLFRAIDSVRQQSANNWKIKISDNGNDEETKKICAELAMNDSRIFYSRNQTNIGALANFKKLISSVDTDFYCILSDDDFLLPGFIEESVDILQTVDNLGFVCSPCYVADVKKKKITMRNTDWRSGVYEPSNEIIKKMYKSHFTSTGVVFRSHLIKKLNGFNSIGDDMLFLTMASAVFKFYVRRDFGAVFTLSSDSCSGSGGIGRNQTIENLCKSFVEETTKIENNVNHELRDTVRFYFIIQYFSIYLRQAMQEEGLQLSSSAIEIKQMIKLIINETAPDILRPIIKKIHNILIFCRKTHEEVNLSEDQIQYLYGNIEKRINFIEKLKR